MLIKIIPFKSTNIEVYKGRQYIIATTDPSGTRMLMSKIKRHGINKPMNMRENWRKSHGCPLWLMTMEAFMTVPPAGFAAMQDANRDRLMRDRWQRALDWNNGVISNDMRKSFPPELWSTDLVAYKASLRNKKIKAQVAHFIDNDMQEMKRMMDSI